MSCDSFEEDIDYSEDKRTSTSNFSVDDSWVSEEPCFKDTLLCKDLIQVNSLLTIFLKAIFLKSRRSVVSNDI